MKKHRIFCAVLAVLTAAGLLSGCTKSDTPQQDNTSAEAEIAASPKVTVDGTKFTVDGKELWINGVNTPWQHWNEFGTDNFEPEFWDSHFADLHEIGINSVRVWVNCTSMVSISLKTTGEVKSVSEKHWQDVDKLFEIAEKHQIYLMPTLLSFNHCEDSDRSSDRWRKVITDETAMQTYIDSYVKPFAERYGSNPYLLGIDLMNEPDWVHENENCGKLPLEDLSKFFAKCTAGAHEANPDILVTVGIAMIKYNSDKSGCVSNMVSDEVMKSYGGDKACLDFYSTHYYNYMKPWWGCPYDMTPEEYGLDMSKPVFLGETNAEGGETLVGLYERCYNNGWSGVMLWASNDTSDSSKLHADNWDDITAAAGKMNEIAPEKVYPTGKK